MGEDRSVSGLSAQSRTAIIRIARAQACVSVAALMPGWTGSASTNVTQPPRSSYAAGGQLRRSPHERLFVSAVAVVGRRSPSNANSHLYLLLA